MRTCKLLTLCAGTLLSSFARAQCPNTTWTSHFATPATGLNSATAVGSALALQVFDPDGPGPIPAELYVAGGFQSAGTVVTKGIARWNGQRWADVGGGVTNGTSVSITCAGLGLHDPDGPGPELPVLVLAGRFTAAGGIPALGIATWNGTQWSALGSGIGTGSFSNYAIADFDIDGPGPLPPRLVVGGSISLPGPVFANMALWDGVQWQPVLDTPQPPLALAVFDDDGPGPLNPALFAGVDQPLGLYRWDGAVWSVVGGGVRSAAHTCASLRVVDEDGPGPGRPVLFAGGLFTLAGTLSVANIARWNGSEWSAVGSGPNAQIESILAVESPTGPPTIYAADGFSADVFRWNPAAQSWPSIGEGQGGFGVSTLASLASFDDDAAGPNPPSVYLGAPNLTSINNVPSRGIARYGCVPCYANCDGSLLPPALNVNDFICFLNRYAAGDPYANCDNSSIPPILNVNDFTCFRNRYAAGCP